ncbi:MAG: P-II family nitrogen regulator [Candidatus Cyclobacteriaceae bacterium M3_2C_046]
MEPIKKIEIVVNAYEKKHLVDLFRKHDIDKYTLIEDVKGKGNRGWQDGDGLTESFKNVYFLIACSESDFSLIKDPLRLFLKKVGGICLITDAHWLLH